MPTSLSAMGGPRALGGGIVLLSAILVVSFRTNVADENPALKFVAFEVSLVTELFRPCP